MAKTFRFEIITSNGRYLESDATFIEARNKQFTLGILPNHAPIVSTLSISRLLIKTNYDTFLFAIGGGILTIKNGIVTLLLNSIERSDEIDINRAIEAEKRAKYRLENLDDTIDKKRALLALARARNRIRLIKGDK